MGITNQDGHNMRRWVLLISGITLAQFGFAQDLRSSLFQAADEALEAAQSANAPMLAPRGYSDGLEAYADAANDLARGRDNDRIQTSLADAVNSLNGAATAAREASIAFNTLIESRDDALEVRADNFAAEIWSDAEEALNNAVLRLEASDDNNAQAFANNAEILFREAELVAIKAQYLSQTRACLLYTSPSQLA